VADNLFQIMNESTEVNMDEAWLLAASKKIQDRARVYMDIMDAAELAWGDRRGMDYPAAHWQKMQFGVALAAEIREEIAFFLVWLKEAAQNGGIKL